MANRWRDWLDQAERDLEQAEASEEDGRHEWACFAAHHGPPEGAPFEHYGTLQSTQALDHARSIIDFVRSQVA
jgi:hypothetical protein